MIELITFTSILVITIINYYKHKDILYPPFIQSTLWLFIIALFFFNKNSYIEVYSEIYILLIIGVFSFSMGGMLASNKFTPRKKYSPLIKTHNKELLLNILFLLSIFSMPFMFYYRNKLGLTGTTDNYYANIRMGLQEDDSGFLKYSSTIALVSLSTYLIYWQKFYKTRLTIIFIIISIHAFYSTGRSFFLLTICILIGTLLITRRVSSFKSIFFGLVFFFIIYLGIAIVLEKGINPNQTIDENLTSFFETFRDYLLGGIPSLQIYASENNFNNEVGANTFRFIYVILDKLGFDVTVVQGNTSFVMMPRRFNVYTVYYPYYADFKQLGVIFFMFIFGFLNTYFYRKADKGEKIYIFLYGISLFPLVMQFFHDQYFTLLSLWIQFSIIYAILYIKLHKS